MGDLIEDTCPVCHDVAAFTVGFDPISIRCHRCGEREYPRLFCAAMWDQRLSQEEAALVAGHMRHNPDYMPTIHDVRQLARGLVQWANRRQKTLDLLNRLADLHGLVPFRVNLRDEAVVGDLMGASSLVDDAELHGMLSDCVASAFLEASHSSRFSFAGRIPSYVWTDILSRPLPATAQ